VLSDSTRFCQHLSDPVTLCKYVCTATRPVRDRCWLCGNAWVLAYLVRYGGIYYSSDVGKSADAPPMAPVTLRPDLSQRSVRIYNFQWSVWSTPGRTLHCPGVFGICGLLTGVALVGGSAVAVLHIQ